MRSYEWWISEHYGCGPLNAPYKPCKRSVLERFHGRIGGQRGLHDL